MSPRRSVLEAQRTRESILERAVSMASLQGMEGVKIGGLAGALSMSKSGVLRHFPTKEELQLATVDRATERFTREVWEPAAAAAPGRRRLLAIADAWLSYLERDVFPGGCFVTSAGCEFDDRPGPVRDALAFAQRRWLRVLEHEARAAERAGELAPGVEPRDVAFRFNSLAMGVNQARRLLGDDGAPELAWRAMRELVAAPDARRGDVAPALS